MEQDCIWLQRFLTKGHEEEEEEEEEEEASYLCYY